MRQMSIIQTADIHGAIADYAYVSAYVKNLRGTGEPVLVVDSGDIFRGSILSEFSQGTVTAAIMNEIGYDFMVFGNDEHFSGTEEIRAMQARLNFPVLGALTHEPDGSLTFDAYGMKQVGGFQVGVIGLEASFAPPGPGGPAGAPGAGAPGGPGAAQQSRGDVLEETRKGEKSLRDLGCDFVMVVSHQGVDESYSYCMPWLARDVPTLDLIADGHSHHPLPEGIREGSVLVTQPEDHLGSFVHIKVEEDDTGNRKTSCHLVTRAWYRENIQPDPIVAAMLDAEAIKVQAATTTFCQTPYLLDGGRPQIRQRETNLGDIVCDALRHFSGAEIAICGGGAIRASLLPGPITNFDVSSVFANGGNLGLFHCKGQWILDQMEHSLSYYPTQAPSFLQIGGLWLVFDQNGEPGKRITSARLDSGEALDPERTYTVAKEIGMFGGHGHGHQQENADCVRIRELGTLEQAMIDYLKSGNARFNESALGRIKAE